MHHVVRGGDARSFTWGGVKIVDYLLLFSFTLGEGNVVDTRIPYLQLHRNTM